MTTEVPLYRILNTLVLSLMTLTFLGGAAQAGVVPRASVGANVVWLDGPGSAFPADFEAGVQSSASLSPHISAVASASYGFSNSYLRWDGGFRVTATDVADPDFNVYLGARYRGGSTAEVRPNEWAPDAGFGWKPNKAWPNIVVGGDAGYGLQSNRVVAILAVRYLIPLHK
jgi:hypothetical protein